MTANAQNDKIVKIAFTKQDIIDGVRHVLEQAGLAPKYIVMDGTLQRCAVQGKPKGKDGAYIVHMDTPPSAWWQNFITGDTGTWCAKNGDTTPEEREILRQRMERDRAAREKAQAERYARGADKARRIWGQSKVVDPRHPYLVAKGINRVGDILQKGNDLVVPVLNAQGEIMSLQFISPAKDPDTGRDKTFLAGGKIAGGYFPIKEQADDDRPLLICEGYATGASLHHASAEASLPPFAYSVLVAFTCGNLEAVARMTRERYPLREVIICADNDAKTPGNPGVKAATEAAMAINGKVAVPQMPDGGKCDFNDIYVTAGAKAVMSQVHAATGPAQNQGTPPRKDDNQNTISFNLDPLPLPSARPAAPALDPALCPKALRPWWEDVSERAEMPLEYCAAASLVVLSSLIGRRCAIRPRRVDDWTVIPNLWGCVVGRPGTMKSLAVELAAAPLQSLIEDANKEHQKALHYAKARKMTLEIEKKELEADYRKAFKSRDDNLCKAAENDLAELQSQIDNECNPKPRRYITGDSTTEKLLEMMRDNSNGLLLKRDEISGWMRSLNRSDRQGDRELYLETWSGTTPYNQDRIGRGEVFVPAMCLSVLGTTQPGKLATYVRGAIKGALEDDGFLQRFQVLVWSEPYKGPGVERKPNKDARDKAYALHRTLADLDAESIGAAPGTVPYLKFEQPAQDLFDSWFKDLKELLRCPEMEPFPAYESHLAKYKSLMPSLALIFHLVDCASEGKRGPITLAAASLAVEWCRFLESHAKKIYAEELGTDAEAAHILAKKIQEGTVNDGWTVRDIYRQEWSGLNTAADAWNAINQLAALRWLAVSETGAVGRKQQVIYINPKVVK